MAQLTLSQLAAQFHCELQGDPGTLVDHVATIHNADAGAISFIANDKYLKYLSTTLASAVILHPSLAAGCPVAALLHPNPYAIYARVAGLLMPALSPSWAIHPAAVVDPQANLSGQVSIGANSYIGAGVSLADGVIIGPNCVVETGSVVGANTRLVASVTVCSGTVIGQRCLLHPGAVLGADGFGIAMEQGRWIKVPQLGCVRLGDDVEVGANTTIDRGAIGDTTIHDGVKLDNQIQIAHNVEIGAHTAIAGCTAIAGSTKIGAYCTIAGAVGIVGHLTIVDRVHITAMTLVTRSISQAGSYSSGTPMMPTGEWHKSAVRFRQLEQLAQKIRLLFKASK